MGRHSEEVIIGQAKSDLDALSVLLADKAYFFGDAPSSIDACVFGFLGVSLYVDGDNPLYRYSASIENLMQYCERMRHRYFPETLARPVPISPGGDKPAADAAIWAHSANL
jgi:glutathione S-transferase